MSLRVGIKISQRSNPSAICVTDSEDRPFRDTKRQERRLLVRHLERLPAGTPIPDIADRVEQVVEQLAERSDTSPTLFLDATGLGQPTRSPFHESAVPIAKHFPQSPF